MKKVKIPATVRNSVWNQNIGVEIGQSFCMCCKSEPITRANFECGHITAEKNGGTLELNNLRPICKHCNTSMGTENMDDFMKKYGFDKIIDKNKKLMTMLKDNVKENLIDIVRKYTSLKTIPYGKEIIITKITTINYDHICNKYIGILKYGLLNDMDRLQYGIKTNKTGYNKEDQVSPTIIIDSTGEEYKTPELLWNMLRNIVTRIIRKQSLNYTKILPYKLYIDETNNWIKTLEYMTELNKSIYCICGKHADKKCSRCKDVSYCSKECQTSDWGIHKENCIKLLEDFIKAPTSDENQYYVQKMMVNRHCNIKEIHCMICGDTNKNVKLNKLFSGEIICSDCVEIQQKIYGV